MNNKYVEHRYDGSEKQAERVTLRPTEHNGKVTGYVVEFPSDEGGEFSTDACAEFHSGTDLENRANAELFVDALRTSPAKRGDLANDLCAVFPVGWVVERDTEYESRELYITEKEACKNATLGVVAARVSPLYKHSQIGDLEKLLYRLKRLLALADRAVGEHNVPSDCFSTGPITGDPVADLVQCPACIYLKARGCCGHASDCAVHNAPALPPGPCDCSV